jgi:hypothetical protein
LDTAVPPPRVLPGQPPDQFADLLRDRRASCGIRVGPFVLDDVPMPGEQSAGRHDPVQPQAFWQQSRQGGHHGAVGPVRLRAGDLTTEDSDLMTEHQDLDVLRGVAAGEQR